MKEALMEKLKIEITEKENEISYTIQVGNGILAVDGHAKSWDEAVREASEIALKIKERDKVF